MFKWLAQTIPDECGKRFEEETKALMHQRVLVVILLGITLIPFFSLLDLVAVPERFLPFLVYRLICALLYGVMIVFHQARYCKDHPFILAVITYLPASCLISLMVVEMGGYGSFYYPGLILVLIACSMIIPLNTQQSIGLATLVYLIYVVPVVLFTHPYGNDLNVFYTNNFFFISFMLITVVQCWNDTRLRIHTFDLRLKLEYYAHNLEEEVDKRAKKLEESELRYRELYEHIVDMVILVNKNGRVIMANPRFYSLVGFAESQAGGMSLIDYVHPMDYDKVRESLLEKLPGIESIKDFQFRLVNVMGEVFNVECNATQITKQGRHVGFQMVVRDITERKRLENQLIESYLDIQHARASTILGLAKLAEYRDHSTGAHLERIREYSKIIADELSKDPKYRGYITDEYIEAIYQSSILHDIGKVGIPDAILLKPGKLLPEEFEIIKCHTTFGGDALKSVEATVHGKSFLTIGKEIAYHHHEKWDGTGYPKGLKGEEIPLSTRIVSLADVYDALTSKREYKLAYSHEEAARILILEKGRHFDPDVVDAFMAKCNTFRILREKINQDMGCEH
ncbi:MAG: PAS domain S-box protein [Proteobacteria bacterium]|nr:PAS domain S-box protein [Pseudomonadota bacterium]